MSKHELFKELGLDAHQWDVCSLVYEAREAEIESLRSRLAEADVCLHSTRVTLIEVAEHSDFEEGAEFGVRSCCHVRDYRPHAESCAVMRAISNIDAFLAREQSHECR
jgi:hypothetical protein